MLSKEHIILKQLHWAKRNNIDLVGSKITRGRKTYTKTLNENLFEPLSKQTKKDIENGDGGELRGNDTSSPKMHALHSSSAIGVNFLQYWNKKSVSDLAYALGLCQKGNSCPEKIKFEQKYKINKSFGTSPNIDAVIINNENCKFKAFGIECKFTEAYSSSHPGLKEKYITDIQDQWKDIPELFKLGKSLCPNDNLYNHLHPAQLIKHILGMKKKYGKTKFKLLYLWYDAIGHEGSNHRKEIEAFSQIAKKDYINFSAISYQELIAKINANLYDGNEKYINYMMERYF